MLHRAISLVTFNLTQHVAPHSNATVIWVDDVQLDTEARLGCHRVLPLASLQCIGLFRGKVYLFVCLFGRSFVRSFVSLFIRSWSFLAYLFATLRHLAWSIRNRLVFRPRISELIKLYHSSSNNNNHNCEDNTKNRTIRTQSLCVERYYSIVTGGSISGYYLGLSLSRFSDGNRLTIYCCPNNILMVANNSATASISGQANTCALRHTATVQSGRSQALWNPIDISLTCSPKVAGQIGGGRKQCLPL